MSEVKEKFSNLIKDQNLNIFDGPFVVKNFLKNVEDYLNWNTLNEAINNDIVEWRLVGEEFKENFEIPWSVPYWTRARQQNKQFILDHVNNGSTFLISGCCTLNDNLKSLISDIQEVFAAVCDIHLYGSKSTNSESFNYHSDMQAVFIIQAIGDTDWVVSKNRMSQLLPYIEYKNKQNEARAKILSHYTPALEVTLSPGDLLYIPPRTYHFAKPSMPRLSMSIPCITLDTFYYLRNYIPNFDQVISQLAADINKYEF